MEKLYKSDFKSYSGRISSFADGCKAVSVNLTDFGSKLDKVLTNHVSVKNTEGGIIYFLIV